MPGSQHDLIAAVDMGSSSFRMVVARVDYSHEQPQIYIIDSLREPVRLGAGLDSDKNLDQPSQQRALECLSRFSERLRSFKASQVRAVATNAVRVARNGAELIKQAQEVLGFDIDVISGAEEARLVYCGVAHQLPMGQGQRLVVDIGGGSTEFIIGEDYKPIAMESLYVGCVSSAEQFFPGGRITPKNMHSAILSARREIVILRRQLTELGWTHVVGSSGTARALAEICESNQWSDHGLTKKGLEKIKDELIRIGDMKAFDLPGVKEDRRYNIPGGLAVMMAVFEELELTEMQTSEGALRQGLLYDLLGRSGEHDMREVTVAQFAKRYAIDSKHAKRVKKLALLWFDELTGKKSKHRQLRRLLGWAATLHEVGLSISHNGHHKHAAYILGKSDMPGFSKSEQSLLADWVLAHNGKLAKVSYLGDTPAHWIAPMCLRLAALFLRRRAVETLPEIHVSKKARTLEIRIDSNWLEAHPLTQFSLEAEMEQWRKLDLELKVNPDQ